MDKLMYNVIKILHCTIIVICPDDVINTSVYTKNIAQIHPRIDLLQYYLFIWHCSRMDPYNFVYAFV